MSMNKVTSLIATTLAVWTMQACSVEETKQVANIADDKKPATFARYVPERSDDFAWENDLIAFRAYGPALRAGAENAGVDCWLKRVNYPIINKWYSQALNEKKSYHEDHGEGLDNYHVGSSAGCGSTSLWLNGERQALETYTKWEIISSTPAETVFVLHYQHELNGSVYQEQKKITIKLGQRLYKAESTFWQDGKLAKNLPITIGISTHDEKAIPQANIAKGWLTGWEHLGSSELGTAIVMDPTRIDEFKVILSEGKKDHGHALYLTHTDDNGAISYYAGYGWKKAGDITSIDQWHSYLAEFNADF